MKWFVSIFIFMMVGHATIAQPTKGRVRVVNSFPTYKIKQVNNNEDFKIRIVNHSPYNNYEWEYVNEFEDFSIQFVDAFEDYKVRFEYDTPQSKTTQQENSQESYIIAVVGTAPYILDTPYVVVRPKSKDQLWFDSVTNAQIKEWEFQDSIRRHKQDSIRRRDSILKKIFWPDDF